METVTKGRNESQWELWWPVEDTVLSLRGYVVAIGKCDGHREMWWLRDMWWLREM